MGHTRQEAQHQQRLEGGDQRGGQVARPGDEQRRRQHAAPLPPPEQGGQHRRAERLGQRERRGELPGGGDRHPEVGADVRQHPGDDVGAGADGERARGEQDEEHGPA